MGETRLNRRQVTAGLAATSLSLSACSPPPKSPMRVAVIGGGIIGASVAYFLSQHGAKVTLLDRDGLATRSSRGTFAWLNASWAKQPQSYHAFNQAGIRGWKQLQSDLNIPIRWGGSLEWFGSQERQARLAAQIDEQLSWGEPARMIPLDTFQALEPNVNFGEANQVAFSGNDGALDPVLATERLAEAAQSMGCEIMTNCDVTGISSSAGETHLTTNQGTIRTDRYVLATGTDPVATKRLAGIDIPQRSTPGVIVVTQPMPMILNHLIAAPGVHIHQRLDGRLVLGEQAGAPDTVAHAQRLEGRPNRFPNRDYALQHAEQILSIAQDYLPAVARAVVDDVYIGWRPLPLDGHPVLGPTPSHPDSYIAISHSGVTLAPEIGRRVAEEIITGIKGPELDAYRPTRIFERVRRY